MKPSFPRAPRDDDDRKNSDSDSDDYDSRRCAAQRRTPSRVRSGATALAADGEDDDGDARYLAAARIPVSCAPPPRGFRTAQIDTDRSASPRHDRPERISTVTTRASVILYYHYNILWSPRVFTPSSRTMCRELIPDNFFRAKAFLN